MTPDPPSPDAMRSPPPLQIRELRPEAFERVWPILQAVVAGEDTFAWPPGLTLEEGRRLWTAPPARAFVATLDGGVVGSYFLRPNQPGLGDHVANCGYMVAPEARGRGLGEALCRHSLAAARQLGFRAMQFNAVVSTNSSAIRAWERCGFAIVGTVPGAFRHPVHGDVAIHVMHRWL